MLFRSYQRVGHLLAGRYSGVDLEPFLALLAVHAELVRAPALPRLVCADPDDDSSSPARMAGGVGVIVSGDEDLLILKSFRGIPIIKARAALQMLGLAAE